MDAETFTIVAWDDVETVLKDRSKMFKMWHKNQGSGFYGGGYWTSKWERNGDSRCPSCRRLNGTSDHLNQC
jgi:hypothetical protein